MNNEEQVKSAARWLGRSITLALVAYFILTPLLVLILNPFGGIGTLYRDWVAWGAVCLAVVAGILLPWKQPKSKKRT